MWTSRAAWGLQKMTNESAARTRYFDQFLLDATGASVRQAVILAMGLDARGYRLPWPTDMTVFEIDQPPVLEFKTDTLAGLGAEPTADLRMVPTDLRQDWPGALRRAGFEARRPTAWIAEGLFGYLSGNVQDRLLDSITYLSATDSRLAVETFVGAADRDSGRVKQIIRTATEGWRDHGFDLDIWSLIYSGARSDVAAYLDRHGWHSVGTTSSQLLADNELPATPAIHDGSTEQPTYIVSVLA